MLRVKDWSPATQVLCLVLEHSQDLYSEPSHCHWGLKAHQPWTMLSVTSVTVTPTCWPSSFISFHIHSPASPMSATYTLIMASAALSLFHLPSTSIGFLVTLSP